MLVLKIKEASKRKVFRRKKKNSILGCESKIINSSVFYFVEVEKNRVKESDVKLLLEKFKGCVLDTNDKDVNVEIKEYLFDPSLYIKRSIISSLGEYLGVLNKSPSVYVFDNSFRFSKEWVDLAKQCRCIYINGAENSELRLFKNYCFEEYGINVFVNEKSLFEENVLKLDLNKDLNGLTADLIFPSGEKQLIYANDKYFKENEAANILVTEGVSSVFACAAIQFIPFKRVYFK